ncbi:NAD(P)-dependent oxidoreductase (plasmid) [Enterococcus sp. 22-H-5-01]|uniref:NAD(P)-dependent oxidoreductase n=1 Tax=Enterococcus sp. 22-H-5-01 TaxID=3418555 RepID=UPI003CFCC483
MYNIFLKDRFSEEINKDYLKVGTKNIDGIIVNSSKIDEEVINEELLCIVRSGIGVDTIDIEKSTNNGTVVMNTPGINKSSVTELIILTMLLSQRPILSANTMINEVHATLEEYDSLQLASEQRRGPYIGHELKGKTVGILGLGSVGSELAKICHSLNMNVLAYDRNENLENSYTTRVKLRHIFKESDFVIIVIPLNNDTIGLVDDYLLSHAKKNCILINFGRAEIVDNKALLKFIRNREIQTYITDFPVNELVDVDNVWMIPHLGGSTVEARKGGEKQALKQMEQFLLYGITENAINFPNVTDRFSTPFRLTVFYTLQKEDLTVILSTAMAKNLKFDRIINKQKNGYGYLLLDVLNTELTQLLLVKKELETLCFIQRIRIIKSIEI